MINSANRDLPSVLLVDDEDQILFSSATLLRRASIRNVKTVSDSRKVLPLLAEEHVGAIVLDLFMPHLSGKDLLTELCRDYPQVPVIVMTAADDLETAVDCMKKGAFDYLLKPVENARFISCVTKALEIFTLKSRMALLEEHLFNDRVEQPAAFEAIVTASKKMQTVFQYCEVIGSSRQPVLISGETGTGKELVARAVHAVSSLPGKFVPVNVAGLDDNLFTDTLFGHRKGAYTGAEEARRGLIESAADGTLFLDEIGDMPLNLQTRLLRVLAEKEILPLGSETPIRVDLHVVCATLRNLEDLVRKGEFREDLYYRLNGVTITLPPLRERKDKALLISNILTAENNGVPVKLDGDAFDVLMSFSWPGNIRQLRNVLRYALAVAEGEAVQLYDLPPEILQASSLPFDTVVRGIVAEAEEVPPDSMQYAERSAILNVLRKQKWNITGAAGDLCISRATLYRKMKKYSIIPPNELEGGL